MFLHKKRPVEYQASIGHDETISNDLVPAEVRTSTTAAGAVGALAVGALAIGAVAFGVLAIGRLAIGRARIRRLEIDELVVGKLYVSDTLETPGAPRAESDKAP